MRPNSKSEAPATREKTETAKASKSLTAVLHWQGQDCSFSDACHFSSLTRADDDWPEILHGPLEKAFAGEGQCLELEPGSLLPARRPEWLQEIPITDYRSRCGQQYGSEPALGRFYSRHCFDGIGNEIPAETWGRVIHLEPSRIHVDFNHPLSDKPLRLALRPGSPTSTTHAGIRSLRHWLGLPGPGMQDRLMEAETDFWQDRPYERRDPGDDAEFFREPSLTPFWDRVALAEVSRLYRRQIRPGSRVLDLMAGVHSPLQEAKIDDLEIHCAGLNAIELEHNPVCRHRRVFDVNGSRPLPWPDASFDALLIHAAIEYVCNPERLFDEIHRVLKPGGRMIVSFSDHFLPQKVIRIWEKITLYERPGLVLAWLRRQGGFSNFGSSSLCGRPRPAEDPRYQQRKDSDPVLTVWAERT